MRFPIHTVSLLAYGAVLMTASTVVAQEPRLTISCQSTNLVPYEPLLVHVELFNPALNKECLIPGRWERLLRVEVCRRGGDCFIPLHRWWRPQVVEPPLPAHVLKPANTMTVDIAFYPFDRAGQLFFEQDHEYVLRASLVLTHPVTNLVSNLQAVQIIKPSVGDASAIAELNTNKQLRFCLIPERIAYDTVTVDSARDFGRRYAHTTFEKYVQATIRLKDSHSNADDRLSEFRKEVQRNSH